MGIELLFVILIGFMIGSFLNVCISRLPQGKSIVFPSSHCPHCGHSIRPIDNIPLLSFLWLRGRCRSCQERISWQYPIVEALTGMMFAATFIFLGFQPRTVVFLLFFSAMIVLVFVDLNERILPNVITLPGILVGLLCSFLVPVQDGTAPFLLSWFELTDLHPMMISFLNSAIGALVCGGFLWLVAEAYFRIRKIEGLGFGDIKLMGMVGSFLGMKSALLTIMLGSFSGAVIGLIYIKLAGKNSRYELPFGSFLGLAAIVSALWGTWLIEGYGRMLGGS